MSKKISLIGAGQIGGTLAHLIGIKELVSEVVLFDVAEGIAKGKALDIAQSSSVDGFDVKFKGTNSYSDIKNSDVIIITAGVPRKPGMSRDDLLSINSNIVKSVTKELVKYSPDTILIIVSNPLDVMVQVAKDASGLPHEKVMGMAGILDTARYRAFIAEEINVSPKDIQAMLMGGHGDTMVPLPRFTTVSGLPISHFISHERLNEIVVRAKKGGGELVGLMGTSAWYAPGTATAQMVEAILLDQDRIFPICAHLDGQYGIDNLYIGVPVKLGKGGIKEVIEVALTNDEQELLNSSAKHVRGTLDAFNALMDK